MSRAPRLAVLALAFALATAGCGSTQEPRTAPDVAAAPPASRDATPDPHALRVDDRGTFLQPNYELPDGSAAYVHVTEADMPLRVAIGFPAVPPRDASRSAARDAAIEAMRMWERAIQPEVPWFRLEFVEEDRSAAVQIEWKRRIVGPWAGFGGIDARQVDGVLRVVGSMQISTQPDELMQPLTLEEMRLMVAHEFGHVLGLGHCLECDSAMSYAWHTRGRVLVTELDVRTFRALLDQPNLSQPGAGTAAR